MRRYAVVGAGLMGRVAAKDFLATEPEARVTLLDFSEARLEAAAGLLGDERVTTQRLDVADRDRAAEALSGHDAAIGALPHAQSLHSIQAAIAAGVSYVDLVGTKPELRRELD